MQPEIGNKHYLKEFAKRLIFERELQGITRHELAQLSDIDIVTIIHIENGLLDFTIEDMISLFQALNIQASKFFKDFI